MRNNIIIAIACALVGCSQQPITLTSSAAATPWDSLANGRAIFQTGKDLGRVQIVAQSHPLYNKCSACHRADGSGGMHLPNAVVSADLRHRALVIEQKHPYTLALLERAIATGVDNEGQKLNPMMPRWKLSQRDLHDVALYVLQKLK